MSAFLSAANVAIAPGGQAVIVINVDPTTENVAGIQASITFPAAASIVSVTAGKALTDAGKTVTSSVVSGTVTFVGAGLNQATILPGPAFLITVSAPANAKGQVNLSIDNAAATDPSGTAIPVKTSPFNVFIQTPWTATISFKEKKSGVARFQVSYSNGSEQVVEDVIVTTSDDLNLRIKARIDSLNMAYAVVDTVAIGAFTPTIPASSTDPAKQRFAAGLQRLRQMNSAIALGFKTAADTDVVNLIAALKAGFIPDYLDLF